MATAPLALERTRCHRVSIPSNMAGNPSGPASVALEVLQKDFVRNTLRHIFCSQQVVV